MKKYLALLLMICMLLPLAGGAEMAGVTPVPPLPEGDYSPYGDLPENDVTQRVLQFFCHWNANSLDDMLELCAPEWKEKQENPRTALFAILGNRTPMSLEMKSISGTDDDPERRLTAVCLFDRHNYKAEEWYYLQIRMVRAGDNLWYIDPECLLTYEPAETEAPAGERAEGIGSGEEGAPEAALYTPETGDVIPEVSLELSKTGFSGPEKVSFAIQVTNNSSLNMVRPVKLYYPNGLEAEDFGEEILAAGETLRWLGEWNVTEAELVAGKISFSMTWEVPTGETDENGEPVFTQRKKSFSKRIRYVDEEEGDGTPAEEETDPDTLTSFAYVRADEVNLRDKASPNGNRVCVMKKYALVSIAATLEKDGEYWYKVLYNGRVGYVSGRYLRVMPIWEYNEFMDSVAYRQGLKNNSAEP